MDKYYLLNETEIREKNTYDISEISPFDAGIPLIDISDQTINDVYYYRWFSFCSHIKMTPLGYIVTEFTPSVSWESLYGSIVCPAGHHMYEGRWLHDKKYLDDYARFWFKEGAQPRLYSVWLADAIYAMSKVSGDYTVPEELYPALKDNFAAWENNNRLLGKNNLLYSIDDCDGMEFSASGSGFRPTINSYQYGDAVALSKIAARLGKDDEEEYFINEYTNQKNKINAYLWDKKATFYKNCTNGWWRSDIRELIGYIPWYFNLPDEDKNEAWKYLNDENYFYAPYGPTTTERNHRLFMYPYTHPCLWNGPSWPFATSQTLTALANFISGYNQDVMTRSDYFNLLKLYANSQYTTNENGDRVPYIDEFLNPFTGKWSGFERGIHYNHSSFCDLVVSGLAGVRAREDEIIEIDPLFGTNDLDYFCCDGILYHGKYLTVIWDKNGDRYGMGKGLKVLVNGEKKAESAVLEKILIEE
ncbi:MAG: hypothetical protein E7672_01425 [Ruminococcaceae bacterium]|nr:hypothetical protein [Oscillospiraceae bacterium]